MKKIKENNANEVFVVVVWRGREKNAWEWFLLSTPVSISLAAFVSRFKRMNCAVLILSLLLTLSIVKVYKTTSKFRWTYLQLPFSCQKRRLFGDGI